MNIFASTKLSFITSFIRIYNDNYFFEKQHFNFLNNNERENILNLTNLISINKLFFSDVFFIHEKN